MTSPLRSFAGGRTELGIASSRVAKALYSHIRPAQMTRDDTCYKTNWSSIASSSHALIPEKGRVCPGPTIPTLAPSTIQGPKDKESLLCGLASSRLISSQRTSTRGGIALPTWHPRAPTLSVLSGQSRAGHGGSRAGPGKGPTRPAEMAFPRDQYPKDGQRRLYHQDGDFHVPTATRLLERKSLARRQHRDKGRIHLPDSVRGRL